MRFLISLLLLIPSLATGQARCLPSPFGPEATSSPMFFSSNQTGICVKWYCLTPSGEQRNLYCGLWGELSKVGGRLETIQKAPDPLKSLNDAGKRFTILPLSDPSLAGLSR